MKRVKIYGAGSIGNHLAQACRRIGWDVVMCDVDPLALKRTKEQIYPSRYGRWDEGIKLYTVNDVPKENFDAIFIGTPPDTHLKIALEILKEKPRLIQIEKPLCPPSLEMAEEFYKKVTDANVIVCVGFDHIVSRSVQFVENILKENILGEIETIDVEFREHWSGIFAAHPWLSGPQDTYLGFWKRGGGASSEHSHATNLWQHFADILGIGKIIEINATMQMVTDKNVDYDKICALQVRTEKGLMGRIIQDVVTKPSRKWARIQGTKGYLEWGCSWSPDGDIVIYQRQGGNKEEISISKKRPDDFFEEILHINDLLEGKIDKNNSAISLERGLDTALVIAAAHHSRIEKQTMKIDYSKGYYISSITPLL